MPLDPTLPPARLEEILRDADAGLLVAGGEAAFDVRGRRVLRMDSWISTRRSSPPSRAITADSLACLLYTSGSTGEPKGVVRTHRNLLHRARCAVGSLGIGADDRVSALHSPAFGAGLRDVLAALLGGATLLPFDVRRAGLAALADWIERERITVLCAVVTTLRHLVASLAADRRLPSIRIVRLGSEALFRADVDRLRERLAPDCVIVAGYGASEASGIVEFRIGPDAPLPPERVPAGYPLEGVEILILGEAGAPLAAGEVGEIAVRSRYLSPGYWRRPDRTRAVFLGDPTSEGTRVYRTGRSRPARARRLPRADRTPGSSSQDPRLSRASRRDRAPAAEHAGIRQAVVVGRDDGGGDTRLVAYVVPAQPPGPRRRRCAGSSTRACPTTCCPRAFVSLDALPVTPNGKIEPRRPARPRTRRRARGSSSACATPSSTRSRRSGRSCSSAAPSGPPTTSSPSAAIRFCRRFRRRPRTCTAAACSLRPRCSRRAPSAPSPPSCAGRKPASDEPLVALREAGARTPFFYLHGDYNGGGLYCHALARGLHPQRPFYVIHPHGIDGRAIPGTIEEMAAEHLRALRAARPRGPYLLGGYCNGGFVALEMARRLRAEGEPVGVIILVESQAPLPVQIFLQAVSDALTRLRVLPEGRRARLSARIDRASDRIAHWTRYYEARLRSLARSPRQSQAAFVGRKLLSAARGLTRSLRLGGAPEPPHRTGTPAAPPAPTLGRRHLYRGSFRRYSPSPFEGRAVLLRAEDEPAYRPDLGWSRLLPRLEVGVIPGEHLSCITRHVDAFAARLEQILRQGEESP